MQFFDLEFPSIIKLLMEALKTVDHQENDNSKLFLEWMRKCYKGNGVELVTWVELRNAMKWAMLSSKS